MKVGWVGIIPIKARDGTSVFVLKRFFESHHPTDQIHNGMEMEWKKDQRGGGFCFVSIEMRQMRLELRFDESLSHFSQGQSIAVQRQNSNVQRYDKTKFLNRVQK